MAPSADGSLLEGAEGGSVPTRLREIFSRLIPESRGLEREQIRFGEVSGWDSLQQIQLLLEIEKAFAISLSAADFSRALSFDQIEALVLEANGAQSR